MPLSQRKMMEELAEMSTKDFSGDLFQITGMAIEIVSISM
jgi:hypothetical protein